MINLEKNRSNLRIFHGKEISEFLEFHTYDKNRIQGGENQTATW